MASGQVSDFFERRKNLDLFRLQISIISVITGATDGIGKGFAQQLANKGMNLVLISRSEAKLNKVSQEIRIAAGVEVKTIVADFSHGEPIYENIREQLESIDIGMLGKF